ncbi:short-chain dehydrogenase/reductase family protein-like protein [Lophiostoma macrostomum CBS 122681]|uniref:Short-chain dehydrogenase/reductase family protein-like protein n=1 Tax=Lophiostoma macrostomum CBS 122681 TaxID=1314788 RepID=A0A6A6T9H5_9PLEO|nr:short-chain dehydrogenase/reductase family protein-like protein [Lophiostoma macrostomum CBS 122681]
MSIFVTLFQNKWNPPKDTHESFTGRNVIVTGSTSGIGLEAAVKYAALGASKVIIAARNLEKAKKVKADIEARVGSKGQLEVWELDLNSYDSIVAFAERANTLEHLDIAILNAGAWRRSFVSSKHGWEEDIQVNTISTTLLGILLLPKLKDSQKHTGKIPILEFVNSGLYENAKIDPDAVRTDHILKWYNPPKSFDGPTQYAISKLFLMFATNKLAEATSPGEVIITSVCPGIVASDLARDFNFPGIGILLWIAAKLVQRSPEEGSRIILSGTTQGERIHGRFWKNDRLMPIGPSVAGEENKKIGQRVWEEIVETLSKDVPVFKEALEQTLGH